MGDQVQWEVSRHQDGLIYKGNSYVLGLHDFQHTASNPLIVNEVGQADGGCWGPHGAIQAISVPMTVASLIISLWKILVSVCLSTMLIGTIIGLGTGLGMDSLSTQCFPRTREFVKHICVFQ